MIAMCCHVARVMFRHAPDKKRLVQTCPDLIAPKAWPLGFHGGEL